MCNETSLTLAFSLNTGEIKVKALTYPPQLKPHIERVVSLLNNECDTNDLNAVTQQTCELALALKNLSTTQLRRFERWKQKQLTKMMSDDIGRVFTTELTDRCLRCSHEKTVCHQLNHLITRHGLPKYLHHINRLALNTVNQLGKAFPKVVSHTLQAFIKNETRHILAPGESKALSKFLKKRQELGYRVNLNHLGEAILGEEEAKARLKTYMQALANPNVEYISVKISTLYSQINLLDWQHCLEILSKRLSQLYVQSQKYVYVNPLTGKSYPKFVNLDMEEYKDLFLTAELFKYTLAQEVHHKTFAGIVLQAYLPDSYELMLDLLKFAKNRVENGGAPIKIRLVKGANLKMEQVEASLKSWPQAPFHSKQETDAHFFKMLKFLCQKEHQPYLKLGIGSHNLFSIAYTLLLKYQNQLGDMVGFEVLEGMAPDLQRTLYLLENDLLVYAPSAQDAEFYNAVAYLLRRLDENTGEGHFLKDWLCMQEDPNLWDQQQQAFTQSLKASVSCSSNSNRQQDRFTQTSSHIQDVHTPFENEADTDWSLPRHKQWAEEIIKIAKNWDTSQAIPAHFGNKSYCAEKLETETFYSPAEKNLIGSVHCVIGQQDLEQITQTAQAAAVQWQDKSLQERDKIFAKIATLLRNKRARLLAAALRNCGKIITESDPELSEAVDFVEYYRRQAWQIFHDPTIKAYPRGPTLLTSPWNFPIAIPLGGIISALACGNSVVFKPAPEAVLVAYELVKICYEAGVPPEVLQFIPCRDNDVGKELVSWPHWGSVILTGGTQTAHHFIQWNPKMNLLAETGGKNSFIISATADRDQAIKDLIVSAFFHSGQKCSAASVAIVHREIYQDPRFWNQLKDAVQSLHVGSPFNLGTKIGPLIKAPEGKLKQALTTLDKGQSWVLKPKAHPSNPCLWSPGIIRDVRLGDFQHDTEFFGPILAIMCAENLAHAIEIANQTPYGLTAGLHSLNEEEIKFWRKNIKAGNLYVNRNITGAIVNRQPFGGTKASNFGPGFKAGGPHYLLGQLRIEDGQSPCIQGSIPTKFDFLLQLAGSYQEELSNILQKFSHFYRELSAKQELAHLVGEDNIHTHIAQEDLWVRFNHGSDYKQALITLSAGLFFHSTLNVSVDPSLDWSKLSCPLLKLHKQSLEEFTQAVMQTRPQRIRVLGEKEESLYRCAAESFCSLHDQDVVVQGNLELLLYTREISFCWDYHRYGNLGVREFSPLMKHEHL